MKIWGAGMAGLLAGCIFQNARIYERGLEGSTQHRALLRFRTPRVGEATGIEFKRVRVHKDLFADGNFVLPSIRLANLYSQKVVGRLCDRSIWQLEPVDRYIAPDDFLDQLAARCAGRIEWGHRISRDDIIENDAPVISTLPMAAMLDFTKEFSRLEPEWKAKWEAMQTGERLFQHERIAVRRWRIPKSDVYQTIYFPSPDTNLYRASITGDLLIAEYMHVADEYDFFEAFGIGRTGLVELERVHQGFGKIAPIDDAWRKEFIFELTSRYKIYSLGRFGTWRNLLLDDVLTDIGVLKKMIGASAYDRSIVAAR